MKARSNQVLYKSVVEHITCTLYLWCSVWLLPLTNMFMAGEIYNAIFHQKCENESRWRFIHRSASLFVIVISLFVAVGRGALLGDLCVVHLEGGDVLSGLAELALLHAFAHVPDNMHRWSLQGGPSGRGTLFVDITIKVLLHYKPLILKLNSYLNVNKSLSSTRWTTL